MATTQRRMTAWMAPCVIALIGAGILVGLHLRFQKGAAYEGVLDTFVSNAQEQIDLQFQTADAHDLKGLGFLGASLTAAGIIVALQHSWSWLWTAPVVGFLISATCFYCSLRNRRFDRGPDLRVFYDTFQGTLKNAKAQILSQLLRAIDDNDAALPAKARWYRRGELFLVFTAVISAVVLLLVAVVR